MVCPIHPKAKKGQCKNCKNFAGVAPKYIQPLDIYLMFVYEYSTRVRYNIMTSSTCILQKYHLPEIYIS